MHGMSWEQIKAAAGVEPADGNTERCPTCGATVFIGGERTTKFYVPTAPAVHILHHARALCPLGDLPLTPSEWPRGNTWVPRTEAQLATCQGCKDTLAAMVEQEGKRP